jgi:hypothetical protein
MNTFYKKQREDALLRIINPRADEAEMTMVGKVLEFVEKEIAAAFSRGLTAKKQGAAGFDRKVSMPTPSALQAGKLRPKVADVEEIQQSDMPL